MKVNRPGSPLSGGSEPLEPREPRELQRVVKGERLAAALSELEAQTGAEQTAQAAGTPTRGATTRAALEQIAQNANLSDPEEALAAVRESARFMIKFRLGKEHRDTPQGESVIDELSEYVAVDPLLKAKLLQILTKIKAK